MLTLFHKPKTRSNSIMWLLEELGVPYETKEVTIRSMDGSGAIDPANPHPHGKVPALEHDGNRVFETGAIALYLTDLFPEKKLGPVPGEALRGEYLSWLFYRSGVLEPALMMRRLGVKHMQGAMGWAEASEVETVLNETLALRPYILGDSFSAADIVTGGGIVYLLRFKMLAETPVLTEYAQRLTSRPAFIKVMGDHT
ncbi:glutathione S-transferase [Rhizomicrobium palustre]|uniref:Glutathione S-transferase n=1 Tax=Rhizomicrobium palustre TaxID=189966 RepID=A0A846MVS4_9PROT|nr:glutathione S-transferase family protein [Rhizomicrobium palustre]NIK87476.1 glutathione S-transferase [Rhizomicrobium palustre]